MIKTILWDVDGTLLDFHAAQKAAIRSLFKDFSLCELSDEMIERYSHINDIFWERLERNEISKQEVLVGRFEQFFEEIGVDKKIAAEFNDRYQLRLGDTIVYRDDSYEIVKSLKNKVKQYVVSNGTIVSQTKKLKMSGFDQLMDGIFLSEAIGIEKPNMGFFDAVFNELENKDPKEIMIVGDSLTSDIQGGINAGLVTCWYNPNRKEKPDKYQIDYIIDDLHEVYELLKKDS